MRPLKPLAELTFEEKDALTYNTRSQKGNSPENDYPENKIGATRNSNFHARYCLSPNFTPMEQKLLRVILLLIFIVTFNSPAGFCDEKTFEEVSPGRILSFPKDHGKHPESQTEWWYFTGNLNSKDDRWGFQLTFFRRSMFKEKAFKDSAWGIRDVYPAHFAITNVKDSLFFHSEIMSREGPGLAFSKDDDLHVTVKNWRAYRDGHNIRLHAVEGPYSIDLTLKPSKPVVLHGDNGFSRKGKDAGQASYYYSFTRMEAVGTLTFDGKSHEVNGLVWMDHEFGSSILSGDQAGWDWFSIQLDDNTELMVFSLRDRKGFFEKPFGTFVQADGKALELSEKGIRIIPLGSWASPRTKTKYPAGWKIIVQDEEIELSVRPVISDQELSTGESTQVVYWEGAIDVTGNRKGQRVTGRGYVELVGYAHSMEGRL